MADYFALSLDHGVKPLEISEIITHLAFYAGWGNAVAAAGAAREVFAARGIAADRLSAGLTDPRSTQ
jgi:4-carboxymuconolactone decarboxylase